MSAQPCYSNEYPEFMFLSRAADHAEKERIF